MKNNNTFWHTYFSAVSPVCENLRQPLEHGYGVDEFSRHCIDVASDIVNAGRKLDPLVQHYPDLEDGVRHSLPVPVDGSGELLERPLGVQAESLLHHAIHLVRVGHPVGVDIAPILTKNLKKFLSSSPQFF